MNDWVTVYKEKERIRAELLKNELEKFDIETVLFDKVDHNYPFLGTIEVKVLKEKQEQANLIIKDFLLND